jgi:ParB-like chromosome segregation protein Spo0J
MKVEVTTLPVANLEISPRVRVRKIAPKDGSDVVLDYAEAYQAGQITEPLDVFQEKNTERYLVADGEHRLLALIRAKVKQVECRVHEGEEIDALRFATGCNQKHGLRRTKADIYHALSRIMETKLRDEFRTDTQLSEQLGISLASIQRYKAMWRESEGGSAPVRAKKEAAKVNGKKHRPIAQTKKKRNIASEEFQATEKKEKKSEPTRAEPPMAKPETPPKVASKPAQESPSRPSQIVLSDFRRGLGFLCDLPPGADIASALNDSDWKHVERVHSLLADLLSRK